MITATARQAITPPREAAIAGLVFSFLLIIGLGIIRLGLPDVQAEQSMVSPGFGKALHLALHLVPFAGIAFLWFFGVLRHQMRAAEDKLFATIFLGSGLLFVASRPLPTRFWAPHQHDPPSKSAATFTISHGRQATRS